MSASRFLSTKHAPKRARGDFRQYNNLPTIYMTTSGTNLQVKLVLGPDQCKSYTIKINQSLARAEADAVKLALGQGYKAAVVVDSQSLLQLKGSELVSDSVIQEILKNDQITFIKKGRSQ